MSSECCKWAKSIINGSDSIGEKKFVYIYLVNNIDNINSSVFSKRLCIISNNTRLVNIFFYIFINENYLI